jgi:hypothetical protein
LIQNNSRMNNKKSATVTVNVTAKPKSGQPTPQQPQQKKKKKQKQNGGTSGQVPEWFNLVRNPWEHESCSIPDEDTRLSHKYCSRSRAVVRTGTSGAVPVASTIPAVILDLIPTPGVLNPTGADGIYVAHYPDENGLGANAVVDPTGALANSYSLMTTTGSVPNFSAICPTLTDGSAAGTYSHHVRCTGIGVKITPTMPELSRGGSIQVGVLQLPEITTSAPTLNGLNLAFNQDSSVIMSAVRNRLHRFDVERMPDGSYEYRWIPRKIPKYHQLMDSSIGSSQNSFTSSEPGAILLMIQDNLAVAATTGFEYGVDVIWHWEVATTASNQMATRPTPSPYSARAMEYCINNFMRLHSVNPFGPPIFRQNATETDVQSNVPSVFESLSRAGDMARSKLAEPHIQSGIADLAVASALGAIGLSASRRRIQN